MNNQTNVKIFLVVLNLQNITTQIPAQVERQQPVYFINALNRHMTFYLEFILSASVGFLSVYTVLPTQNGSQQVLTSVLRSKLSERWFKCDEDRIWRVYYSRRISKGGY
jgi:hypothetical protein